MIGGPAEPPDDSGDLLAVWPDLLGRRRTRVDAFLTADLLVLAPRKQPYWEGVRRGLAAAYGLGRDSLRTAALERAQALLDAPLADVRRRPDVRTVRWSELRSVRLKSTIAGAWVLRLEGQPAPFDKLTADDRGLVPVRADTAALLRELVGARLRSKS